MELIKLILKKLLKKNKIWILKEKKISFIYYS